MYHGEHGVRTLKELGRSYLTLTQDVTRVMNRIKAVYRSWAIPCAGTTVYAPRHRASTAELSAPARVISFQTFARKIMQLSRQL